MRILAVSSTYTRDYFEELKYTPYILKKSAGLFIHLKNDTVYTNSIIFYTVDLNPLGYELLFQPQHSF